MKLPNKKNELVKFTSDYLANWFKNWDKHEECGDIIFYHYDYETKPIFIPYFDDGESVTITSFAYDKLTRNWMINTEYYDVCLIKDLPMNDLRKLFWDMYQMRENDY